MPKRGENIHKRKDGRWEGRYKNGYDETGKSKYASVYARTYTEVKSKLSAAIQHPTPLSSAKNRPVFFQEVLSMWMHTNRIKFKGQTEAKYEYLIERHIAPELGHLRIPKVTMLKINTFMEEKLQSGRLDGRGGLSPSYVRSMMLIISSALQYAVNEQMCKPLSAPIYKPTEEKKELPILTGNEQKRFEAILFSDLDPTKIGILISLHTGLRIGEVCALTWDDVDFTQNIIHVRSTVTRIKNKSNDCSTKTILTVDKPKTKSSIRDIPISSVLRPVLKKMSKISQSKYVTSENASFISPRTYEYRYHKLLDYCGINSINYHALRHTFATRCIEVGVDVKTLSEILGHANVSITLDTYVHSSMELKRKQLEKLTALSA